MMVTRRQFLGAAAVVGGTAALTSDPFSSRPTMASAATSTSTTSTTALPAPAASGIDHIVVVMMENRSFDHFMGWLPGANGKQSGLTYVDRYGVSHSTHHLTQPASCGHQDPDHSYEGGRIQLNGGRAD